MTIDYAADVALILGGTNPDFARTTGTYSAGNSSQSIEGVIINRTRVQDPLTGLDEQRALLIVQSTQFTTVTARNPEDTFTISGETDWVVDAVNERVAHFAFDLVRRDQRTTAGGTPGGIPNIKLWLEESGFSPQADGETLISWTGIGPSAFDFLPDPANSTDPNVERILFVPPPTSVDPTTRFLAAELDDGIVIKTVSGGGISGAAGHVFMVVSKEVSTGLGPIFSSADTATDTNSMRFGIDFTTSSGGPYITSLSGTENTVYATTPLTPNTSGRISHLIEFASDGSSYTIRVDGVAQTLATQGVSVNDGRWFDSVAGRDNIAIGGEKTLSGISANQRSFLGELVYVEGVMTASARAELELYFIQRWKVPVIQELGSS